MMDHAKGMKVYNLVLQSVRMQEGGDNKIGPGHHMHDKQFKEWCKGKSKEEIEAALNKQRGDKKSSEEAKKVPEKTGTKQLVSKAVNKGATVKSGTVSAKKAVVGTSKTVLSQKQKDDILREKWRKEQIQKLADGIKGDGRLRDIKSVGNGL